MSQLPSLTREELLTLYSVYMHYIQESIVMSLPFDPKKEDIEAFQEAIATFIIANRKEEK